MIQLTADEARVLGVLIEKASTTPDQYPLTLNATVNGCNQKNNRDPIFAIDDGRVFDALEGLRVKGLSVRVDTVGSRTNKYKHMAQDVLRVRAGELAVLAELLLRGPQTLGEIRGRASRMHPLDSLDVAKTMIRALTDREEPLVRQIAPSPGSRAERYVQLLCPDAAAEAETPTEQEEAPLNVADSTDDATFQTDLADRVATLEAEVAALRGAPSKLAAAVGEADPLEQ